MYDSMIPQARLKTLVVMPDTAFAHIMVMVMSLVRSLAACSENLCHIY